MGLRIIRSVVMVLVIGVGVAGCAWWPTAPPAGPAPTAPVTGPDVAPPSVTPGAAATTVWSYEARRPVTRFVGVGPVVVGLTIDRGRLRLTGLDGATGSVLWDRDAHPGHTPPGVVPFLTVHHGLIVYLDPDPNDEWATRITVLRGDGSMVSQTTRAYYVESGSGCGPELCFEARTDRDGALIDHRMDLETAAIVETGLADPRVNRGIGSHGLVSVGTDETELGRVVDGRLMWHVRFDELFAADFRPSGGWSWAYDQEQDVFVGSVGYLPETSPEEEDLSRTRLMVGIDATTGHRRWVTPGGSPFCGFVRAVAALGFEDTSYRCRYSGTNSDRLTGVSVAFEKVDPGTGAAVWSIATPPFTGDHDDWPGVDVRIVSDRQVLIGRGPTATVVDVGTGSATPAHAVDQAWCVDSHDVTFAGPSFSHDTRTTGDLVDQCTGDGTTLRPVRWPPEAVSARVGDLRIVTGRDQVSALRAG